MNSDSSDEENLALLKEAQDNVFLSESLFTNPKAHFESAEATQKGNIPSLRKTKEEDSKFNLFSVTPEFQKYIAKRLTTILDEKLDKMTNGVCSDDNISKGQSEGGIKLFSISENFLEITDSRVNENLLNSNRKSKQTAVKMYVKKEELKNVVVSGEEILAKEDIKYWSTRTKGKIFHYLKNDNGQLILKE